MGMHRAARRQSRNKERRGCTRYALALDFRYTASHWRIPKVNGSGRIIDFSSSGLRFTADKPLEAGIKVELFINWPPPVEGEAKLQLVVSGTVVWSKGTEMALQLRRHVFRREEKAKTASSREIE
jgi:hypothetical protein